MTGTHQLQHQAVRLRHLLALAEGDAPMHDQLAGQLERVEQALATAPHAESVPVPSPRTALFLRGEGVLGSEGIRAGLAGRALVELESIYVAFTRELERGNSARTRRTNAQLMLAGTPRGSFGLEVVAHPAHPELEPVLQTVAEAIGTVVRTQELEVGTRGIPEKALAPMQRFIELLATNGTELRFAHSDRTGDTLTLAQLQAARERLGKQYRVRKETVFGTFRGLMADSGRFDFRGNDGMAYTGSVSDELDDDNLRRIARLFDSPCRAELELTEVEKPGGARKRRYVLIDATEAPATNSN
jgi:hypothetical protein